MVLSLSGERGLEIRRHGDRPNLPVDVHYCVSAGDHRAVPTAVASWHDLAQTQKKV